MSKLIEEVIIAIDYVWTKNNVPEYAENILLKKKTTSPPQKKRIDIKA